MWMTPLKLLLIACYAVLTECELNTKPHETRQVKIYSTISTHSLTFQKPNDQKYLGAADQLIRNANLQHRLANVKDNDSKLFEVTIFFNTGNV